MHAAAEREFREFVSARCGSLFATAYLLTGQREAAEDLLQTALATTARRWEQISQPEAYVRKALYLQQVNRWRLRSWGRERSTDAVPDHPTDRDPIVDSDTRLSLAAALRRLGPRQRAVVMLRYLDDLPDSTVAELLDISVGTVRSQCHRALIRLRAICPDLAPDNRPAEVHQ
jgi:RNA polymerase sigma-70 factor (sigma-E family)